LYLVASSIERPPAGVVSADQVLITKWSASDQATAPSSSYARRRDVGSREFADPERQPEIRWWRLAAVDALSRHPSRRAFHGIRRWWGKFPISTGHHCRVPYSPVSPTPVDHLTPWRPREDDAVPAGQSLRRASRWSYPRPRGARHSTRHAPADPFDAVAPPRVRARRRAPSGVVSIRPRARIEL